MSKDNGDSLSRPLDLGGFGLSRYTLDAALAALAVKKGVLLLDETKVFDIAFENDEFSIKTAQKTYKARVACGAYGKRSLLDKKLERETIAQKKNYIGVKYHVKLDLPDHRIELHNFKDGYCGVSKIEDNKYCLCYLTTAQNLKDNGNDIKKMEQVILMQNPFLNHYFSNAEFLYAQPLTISQITFSKKTAVQQHVLMLGDAAGNIAPLCGNGMSMAMHAAFLAAPLIQQYLDKQIAREMLEMGYKTHWNAQFSNRIKAGRYLQHLFGREILTNFSIGLLKNIPVLTDKLIKMTHGVKF